MKSQHLQRIGVILHGHSKKLDETPNFWRYVILNLGREGGLYRKNERVGVLTFKWYAKIITNIYFYE